MPHIIVEYTRSLGDVVAVQPLLLNLHNALGAQETVDVERIKTRAVPLDPCVVGGAQQEDLMIHIAIKLMPHEKRTPDVMKGWAMDLRDIASGALPDGSPCKVTAEILMIDAATYCG